MSTKSSNLLMIFLFEMIRTLEGEITMAKTVKKAVKAKKPAARKAAKPAARKAAKPAARKAAKPAARKAAKKPAARKPAAKKKAA
jgi:hypothetical protein